MARMLFWRRLHEAAGVDAKFETPRDWTAAALDVGE